jgi:hypothetical protein
MDIFLERCTKDEIENLKRLVNILKAFEVLLKKLSIKKILGPDGFTGELN